LLFSFLITWQIIRIIKMRRMRWVGHGALMGEKRNVYRLLVRKPEGKRPLGSLRHRWMDNIKMDLLETGLNVVNWIGLALDRYRWRALVNSVMNLRVPYNAGNYQVAAQLVVSRAVLSSTELAVSLPCRESNKSLVQTHHSGVSLTFCCY
jgi:hypothetical protein